MLRAKRRPVEIPTSSMADLAFLLLVFFLVTTCFLEDRGLGLILPATEGKDVRVPRANVMHIMVYDRDDLAVRYRDLDMRVPLDELRSLASRTVGENPKLVVNLKTAPSAPYDAMIQALDELRAADVRKISIGQLKS